MQDSWCERKGEQRYRLHNIDKMEAWAKLNTGSVEECPNNGSREEEARFICGVEPPEEWTIQFEYY